MSKKYNVLYVDPPWKTKAGRKLEDYSIDANGKQIFAGDNTKARELAYPSMSVAEIKKLNVAGVSEDNAHLYMWVTNQYLMEAGEVIKAWGFKYSTTLVWAKNMFGGGLGGTFKINTEYLIFATKGKLPTLKSIKGTWFNIKRQYVNGAPKHSKKPDFFYELIETVSPGTRLEMFAREKRDGWDIWGNELKNDIEL
jgi:N6-adenosine-specific RNA methylase IME4